MSRLDEPFDAALHLLDRQVVDAEGRLVCKADDVELAESPEGALAVTALLSGAPVLVPRLGGRLGSALHGFWLALGPEQAERAWAYRIEPDDIAELGSHVTHRARRPQLLRPEPVDEQRKLTHLLGMATTGPDGRRLRVLDVRLERAPHPDHDLRVTGLLLGRGRPGTLLGYDRHEGQGPAVVAAVVRALHRHSRLVAMDDVSRIDWDEGRVEVAWDRSGTATR